MRIDSLTQDWYPTARLGEVIDAVVRRDGRDGELFTDDKYPTAELSGLMIEEIGRRCGAVGGEHGAGQGVVVGRAGDRRRAGPAGAGRAGRGGGPLRLGGILLRRASQPAHAEGLHAGGAAVPGLVRGAGGGAGRRSRRAWSASTSSAWAARRPSGI